jgi:cytochrome c oxidase subunit 1
MAIISEIIPHFSRKPIFGYKFIAYSSLAIALIGFLVWGHHMFTSGQSEVAIMIFSALTFLVAIPSAIKVFNWTATLYRGSITLATPMLYALSFMFLFTIGGLTGLFLGALATDVHLHDTYFVVAHFHYVMVGGTVVAFLGGLHYWWPKMFGRMYPERMAQITCGIIFLGFNMTFLTQFVLGSRGMQRRYATYDEHFQPLHAFSSVGAWVMGVGFAIMFIYLSWSLFKGERAGANPWNLKSLEWQTASPPIHTNFHETPVIDEPPYNYGVKPEEATVKR